MSVNIAKSGLNENQGFVVWLTGLSGAGKSTLAEKLASFYREQGRRVEHLDGELIRGIFPTGFTHRERDEHIRRVGFMASLLERNGVIVIASFISPYHESRLSVRRMCSRFIEVYVNASLVECERRDTKGLYRRARSGEIKNFTGIDDPYEVPLDPEIVVKTEECTVENSFSDLRTKISRFIAK
jgi:adenylylsulfate kinase